MKNRRFVAFFWFVGWNCISLGIHFCTKPNIEIHLPFGFIRIGLEQEEPYRYIDTKRLYGFESNLF